MNPPHPKNQTGRNAAIAFAAWCVGAAITFRIPLFTKFDTVHGGIGDTSLIIYIHEHLFRWLQGQASFVSPDHLYPQRHVLGFTDAVLLDLPLYAVARTLGFGPFVSHQLLVIALSLVCYVSATVILTRFLKVQIWIAVAAALLITFPHNLIFKTTVAHNQFFALYYIPPIALLALWSIKDFPRLAFGSFVCAALSGLLFALLFATSFYSAWMFALTCLIAAVSAGIRLRHQIRGFVIEHRRVIAALGGTFVAGFAIGLIPFALIYGPVLALVPGRAYREYLGNRRPCTSSTCLPRT